jgi:hypothetical protein
MVARKWGGAIDASRPSGDTAKQQTGRNIGRRMAWPGRGDMVLPSAKVKSS